MANFIPGQKLTAASLNEAINSVAGVQNPSNDYQWTKTSLGNLQSLWSTYTNIENQNPHALDITVSVSDLGNATIREVGGVTPKALRRVFMNIGNVGYKTFGPLNLWHVPDFGDFNGIPFIGAIGIQSHPVQGGNIVGDGKIHYSLWSDYANGHYGHGNDPATWASQQKLYNEDVVRNSDIREWWWTGITLEALPPDNQLLDIIAFPMDIIIEWDTQKWHNRSSSMPTTLPLLGIALEQDYYFNRDAIAQIATVEQLGTDIYNSYGQLLGFYPRGLRFWNDTNVQTIAQYVHPNKVGNACYKQLTNYVSFKKDFSANRFATYTGSPLSSENQISPTTLIQYIDKNGVHKQLDGTYYSGTSVKVTDLSGNQISGISWLANALAIGYTKYLKQPVLSCVSVDVDSFSETGYIVETVLSSLFNSLSALSNYNLTDLLNPEQYSSVSNLTCDVDKRLIWLNTNGVQGYQYFETCPDFRSGPEYGETPDSEVSSVFLSSLQKKEYEWEDESGNTQSAEVWNLWQFDDFENVEQMPQHDELSAYDLVTRYVAKRGENVVCEVKYISLSGLSAGNGFPPDADVGAAEMSSIQTRQLANDEKVLQLYRFNDYEYVQDNIGSSLSSYDMVLRNRDDNCVAYGSLSSIGGQVTLSGTDGSFHTDNAFKFQSASDSNIIVSIGNNGVIQIGAYYI